MTSARVLRDAPRAPTLAPASGASGDLDPWAASDDPLRKPARVAARTPTGPAGSPVRAVPIPSCGAVSSTAAPVDWLPEAQSQPLLEAAASPDRTGTVLLPAPTGGPLVAAACADLPIRAGRPLGGGPNPCGRRFRESPLQARGRQPRHAPPRILASHPCSPPSR